jgi:hypothetical protein
MASMGEVGVGVTDHDLKGDIMLQSLLDRASQGWFKFITKKKGWFK